jgi:hypothetical protein
MLQNASKRTFHDLTPHCIVHTFPCSTPQYPLFCARRTVTFSVICCFQYCTGFVGQVRLLVYNRQYLESLMYNRILSLQFAPLPGSLDANAAHHSIPHLLCPEI